MTEPRYTVDKAGCIYENECFVADCPFMPDAPRIAALLNDHADMLTAIIEYLGATDYAANNSGDDIDAMLRFGKADDELRTLIQRIAERSKT